MNEFFFVLLKATLALFIIVDPIGLIPLFLELTKDMSEDVRKKTLKVAMSTATTLLFLFALLGREILLFFNISIYSFMIAGGFLLFVISMEILIRGEPSPKGITAEDIGVIPIAFPLLVGPGAITTTIVTLQINGFIYTILSIIVVMAASWVILHFASKIYKVLGRTGSAITTRVLAIFVAAIGVQMILDGIKYFFP